jgi:hypothetical protein
MVLADRFRVERAAVQEAEVRGVDVAFQRLQPVAVAMDEGEADVRFAQEIGLDVG